MKRMFNFVLAAAQTVLWAFAVASLATGEIAKAQLFVLFLCASYLGELAARPGEKHEQS